MQAWIFIFTTWLPVNHWHSSISQLHSVTLNTYMSSMWGISQTNLLQSISIPALGSVKLSAVQYCLPQICNQHTFYSLLMKELVWFSNRSCSSFQSQPFYMVKWVWAKMNNTVYCIYVVYTCTAVCPPLYSYLAPAWTHKEVSLTLSEKDR